MEVNLEHFLSPFFSSLRELDRLFFVPCFSSFFEMDGINARTSFFPSPPDLGIDQLQKKKRNLDFICSNPVWNELEITFRSFLQHDFRCSDCFDYL